MYLCLLHESSIDCPGQSDICSNKENKEYVGAYFFVVISTAPSSVTNNQYNVSPNTLINVIMSRSGRAQKSNVIATHSLFCLLWSNTDTSLFTFHVRGCLRSAVQRVYNHCSISPNVLLGKNMSKQHLVMKAVKVSKRSDSKQINQGFLNEGLE